MKDAAMRRGACQSLNDVRSNPEQVTDFLYRIRYEEERKLKVQNRTRAGRAAGQDA